MAKNPKIELPLRNDFGILCDPKIVPNTNLDTVCFTLPLIFGGGYDDQGEAVLNPIQFDAETTGWVDADKDVNVQP